MQSKRAAIRMIMIRAARVTAINLHASQLDPPPSDSNTDDAAYSGASLIGIFVEVIVPGASLTRTPLSWTLSRALPMPIESLLIILAMILPSAFLVMIVLLGSSKFPY